MPGERTKISILEKVSSSTYIITTPLLTQCMLTQSKLLYENKMQRLAEAEKIVITVSIRRLHSVYHSKIASYQKVLSPLLIH
jgi:hypothetical protein